MTTHSADCYKWHHDCAVAEVERLRAALAQQAEPVEPVAWLVKWANAYDGEAYTEWQKGYDAARSVVKAHLPVSHTQSHEPEQAEPTRSQRLADAGFTRRPSLWSLQAREALELIAVAQRPDGTWNRDREACRQIAAEALGRYDDE